MGFYSGDYELQQYMSQVADIEKHTAPLIRQRREYKRWRNGFLVGPIAIAALILGMNRGRSVPETEVAAGGVVTVILLAQAGYSEFVRRKSSAQIQENARDIINIYWEDLEAPPPEWVLKEAGAVRVTWPDLQEFNIEDV